MAIDFGLDIVYNLTEYNEGFFICYCSPALKFQLLFYMI